ncbi:Eukaryotic translation initiation factor 3 subunit A [Camellia lanceoleosa]|uniref:Eukaryotic translation initiation factor 3 subunit A n=1 Tax=Camellia lanceoleosa TaxID=1840588 RepID=A0ACC0HQ71_9ERIC|nr:Eukaryotic translation initiation factor 3 subunit A [Camellia lanceoleosa]
MSREVLSRSSLLIELVAKGVMTCVTQEVKDLYHLLGHEFLPLDLASKVQPLLTKISKLGACHSKIASAGVSGVSVNEDREFLFVSTFVPLCCSVDLDNISSEQVDSMLLEDWLDVDSRSNSSASNDKEESGFIYLNHYTEIHLSLLLTLHIGL